MGNLFLDDQEVTKDSSVAIGWYLKAAFQGDMPLLNTRSRVFVSHWSRRRAIGLCTASGMYGTSSLASKDKNMLDTILSVFLPIR